ncbi:MAG TPA: hypothetical protein VGE63_03470 [Candidatus Paceibacterota bacterium]
METLVETLPSSEEKSLTLLENILYWTMLVWFASAVFIASFAFHLSKKSSSYEDNISYETTILKLQNPPSGVVYEFWHSYYNETTIYDYSTDRYGDRKFPLTEGETLNLVFVLIFYTAAWLFKKSLEEKFSLTKMVGFIIALSLPIIVNCSKFSFLLWASQNLVK